MILKTKRSVQINSLNDLELHFNARVWLEENIEMYEAHNEVEGLMNELLTSFFSQYRGNVSVMQVNPSEWIITEIVIPNAVIFKNTIIPCNTLDKAKDIFCTIAHRRLAGYDSYKRYPKDKIDYSVLESMINSTDIPLQIV